MGESFWGRWSLRPPKEWKTKNNSKEENGLYNVKGNANFRRLAQLQTKPLLSLNLISNNF